VRRGHRPFGSSLSSAYADIRLLVLDVDGVCTDGGLWVDAAGQVSKRFYVRDGSGMVRLQRSGVPVCWLTGRSDPSVEARAKELGIARLVSGCHDKADGIRRLSLAFEVPLSAVAYMGDDLLDLPAIRLAGLGLAPADAAAEVLAAADEICDKRGGQGCVRDLCDRLIAARKEGQ
jgi:3-deoxy-D-manno-octulosonate 8-phosphate phosphatase (KDO 8-P phosphatase)